MRAREKAGGPAAGIEVDFGQVGELVILIRALAHEFAQNGTLYRDLYDPDLASAFHRVEHNWRKQRHLLQTFLDSAAHSIEAGLAQYRQLEAELGQAARGGHGNGQS
jgi:hypothetical protein